MHWFFSLSNFVIPSKCLKNFICAASKCYSSLFFNTQASLPNFNAALAVMLWILNFVSLFICFPTCLCIAPFILRICVCKYQHLSLPLFWSTLCLSALHKFPSCKIWGSHSCVGEVSSPLASDIVIFCGIILLSSSVLNSPIRRAIFSGQLVIFLDWLPLKMKAPWPFQTPATTCVTTVSHPTWQMFLPNCQNAIHGCFR